MVTTGKFYISGFFYIDVYLSFSLFDCWLFTITYTAFYLTHIPDKFTKFNEFNKILKQENSFVLNK